MTAILDWPADLWPRNISIRPPRQTKSMSRSLTSFVQVVPVVRAPFGMTLEFQNLAEEKVRTFRALVASLHGRANLIRVPIMDVLQIADSSLFTGTTGHSNGAIFASGAGYSVPDIGGVSVTANQGAGEITVDFGAFGHVLNAGEYFGIGDHPYIVKSIEWTGNLARIGLSPTLRKSYAGAALRLRPVMICRQSNDEGGEHSLEYGRWTSPTLDLEEAFVEPFS